MKKPDREEVRRYWNEAALAGDPSSFFDHFESNGWKVGGKAAMKDWKAAARNWSRRETAFKKPPRWCENERRYTEEELNASLRDPLAEL